MRNAHRDHQHDHPHDHDNDHPHDHDHVTPKLGIAPLLVVLAVAVIVGVMLAGCSASPRAVRSAPTIPVATGAVALLKWDSDPTPLGGQDARTTVEQFLTAEVAGRYDESFRWLSDADRSAFGPVAQWGASATSRPAIRAFDIVGTDGATVAVKLRIEPAVDETSGVVPSQADARFATVPTAEGFRVDFSATEVRPVYTADPAQAVNTALTWASARQRCTTASQYDGSLLGQPKAGDQLCGTSAVFSARVGGPFEKSLAATAVTNAFGPAARDWAQVIDLDGPSRLQVTLAPLGNDWVVVAVHNRA